MQAKGLYDTDRNHNPPHHRHAFPAAERGGSARGTAAKAVAAGKSKNMNHQYTCAYCGDINTSERSDEEAKFEAEQIFGSAPDEWNGGYAVICDDCYQKMHPTKYPDLVEQVKSEI